MYTVFEGNVSNILLHSVTSQENKKEIMYTYSNNYAHV